MHREVGLETVHRDSALLARRRALGALAAALQRRSTLGLRRALSRRAATFSRVPPPRSRLAAALSALSSRHCCVARQVAGGPPHPRRTAAARRSAAARRVAAARRATAAKSLERGGGAHRYLARDHQPGTGAGGGCGERDPADFCDAALAALTRALRGESEAETEQLPMIAALPPTPERPRRTGCGTVRSPLPPRLQWWRNPAIEGRWHTSHVHHFWRPSAS